MTRPPPVGHSLVSGKVIWTPCGEAEPDTDGREGLRSLEVLIASYLSARDGCGVTLRHLGRLSVQYSGQLAERPA